MNGSDEQQACAACRHQRKKCPRNCVLAPFFPSRERNKFQAVHKVFGLSNVQKMIKRLETPEQKARASESLVWEAEWRLREGVEGCFGEYKRLVSEANALRQHVRRCVCSNNSINRQRINGWSNNSNNYGDAGTSHDANNRYSDGNDYAGVVTGHNANNRYSDGNDYGGVGSSYDANLHYGDGNIYGGAGTSHDVNNRYSSGNGVGSVVASYDAINGYDNDGRNLIVEPSPSFVQEMEEKERQVVIFHHQNSNNYGVNPHYHLHGNPENDMNKS